MSSNLAEADKKDPKKLLASIINDVERFVGAAQELEADPAQGLVGGLNSVDPDAMYKIQMSQPASLDLSGTVALPDEVSLTLQKGWNWIGYVPTANLSVTEALKGHTPQEDDFIKGQESFATYHAGQWTGTLATLEAGKGYMYYSGKTASFKYPYSRFTGLTESHSPSAVSTPVAESGWSADAHRYPDNLCMVANVVKDETTIPAGVYTIGAFCGDECRGTGTYVNGLLFLTVHGNASDEISFKAFENATGTTFDIQEKVTMEESMGTMGSPYLLHIKNGTGMDSPTTENDFNIYPNPVRHTLFVNGPVEEITGLKVVAVSGAIMASTTAYDADTGWDVSHLADGNYILGIITDKGIVYKRFIKVSK